MRTFLAVIAVLALSGVLAAKEKKEKYQKWLATGTLTSKTSFGPDQMVEIRPIGEHKTYSCILAEPDARFYLFHIGDTLGVSGKKQDSSTVGKNCFVFFWTQK